MNRPTYIFDIDGTLANLSHRLHFIEGETKDWDGFFAACEDDEPIQSVIDVARAVAFYEWQHKNTKILYLTGRPERVRGNTIRWLNAKGLPPGDLIMRKNGDHRPDTEAKRELMEKIVAEGGKIVGVFEDRPSVCRVWRKMGLTVFQMNDEEF
jgi:hypothetical protein